MKDAPLISILIPAYNHELYIMETIQSIVKQDYKNIELIVIDDGSQDKTWKILQSLKDICKYRFTRFILKQQQNVGTCITLNRLLDEAFGDYIYIIASDDCMAPNACSSLVTFLNCHPEYVLAVGDNAIIDANSKIAYWDKHRKLVYSKHKARFYTFADFLKNTVQIPFNDSYFGKYPYLFCQNHIPNGYMIRKKIFDTIRFTTKAPLEDWYLMLQLAKYGKFKFLNNILFYYRWHDTNTVKNKIYMAKLSQKTIFYEREILKKINLDYVLPDVKTFIQNGIEYKRKGIHNVFEIVKIVTVDNIFFEIRLFTKRILKFKKYLIL